MRCWIDHRLDDNRDDHERYIDRPRAFEAAGRRVAHVLPRDWLTDPDGVLTRLLTLVGQSA